MPTTVSLDRVTSGEKVVANDVNTPFSTIEAFLNSIDGGNITAATIPGTSMKANSIPGTALIDSTIPTGKLGNLAVTAAKIANTTITAAQVAAGTLTNTQISATAAIALSKLASGVARVHISSYDGDNNVTQMITGIGFTPGIVFIFKIAASPVLYIKHKDHVGTATSNLTTPAHTTGVVSLDADGFTVSSNCNALATYGYLALASN